MYTRDCTIPLQMASIPVYCLVLPLNQPILPYNARIYAYLAWITMNNGFVPCISLHEAIFAVNRPINPWIVPIYALYRVYIPVNATYLQLMTS